MSGVMCWTGDMTIPLPRPLTSLALAIAAALTLSSCAIGGDLIGQLSPDAPSESQTGSAFAGDYFDQTVSWSDCDAELLTEFPSTIIEAGQVELRCGEVIVPANYDDLSLGVDYRIQLMKLSVDPDATDRDAIFVNPGGPGGSGVEQVQTSDFPDPLIDVFDFIGFDPRGVGTSVFTDGTTIKCSDELDYLSYFEPSAPTSLEEYQALVSSSDEYFLDCTKRNPLWWTLSTAEVVKDLDIIRQATTGDKPLNFIGSSYGTTIAGRYVTEFPDNVGKIVFDSPTTVNEDRIESALQGLEADEAKLRGYLEFYAGERGISVDDAFARLLQVRDWARSGELLGFAGPTPSTSSPGNQVSSEALLNRGLLTLNYFPEADANDYFVEGLDQAYNEQWNELFEWLGFYLDGYNPDSLVGESLAEKNIERSNEFEVRYIVNSMDYSLPDLTEEEQRDLSERSKQVAPLLSELGESPNGYEYFGPPLGIDFQTIAEEDPTIPDPPTTPFIPENISGRQLLIVGATDESVTPFAFAEETAELLGSPLIAVESSRHAPASYYTSKCLNDILFTYFTTDQPITPTTCPE
jgi:pimeloyl-ACP methyl ester carboxylesterase